MLIVTTDSIADRKIVKVLGLVKGSTVRSKNIGKDIGAGLKGIVGGELNAYTEMLTESRQIAIGRMVEEAESMGANAIVALRLQSAAVRQGAGGNGCLRHRRGDRINGYHSLAYHRRAGSRADSLCGINCLLYL